MITEHATTTIRIDRVRVSFCRSGACGSGAWYERQEDTATGITVWYVTVGGKRKVSEKAEALERLFQAYLHGPVVSDGTRSTPVAEAHAS